MGYIGIFEVVGPNMVGPSSSHTAGAASIGRMARKMCPEPIGKVRFILYGSFARTYAGHGTDRALLGGILGFAPDDLRIRDAFLHAQEQNVDYEFLADVETETEHPNTVDIEITGIHGYEMRVRGESIGGGKIRITRIQNIQVEISGEYSTLIIRQKDTPGVLTHITRCLSNGNVNIAFMRLFRETKGGMAYSVVESDERIPDKILEEIRQNGSVYEVLLIQDQKVG